MHYVYSFIITSMITYLPIGRGEIWREFGRRELIRCQGTAKGRRELGKVHFWILEEREGKIKVKLFDFDSARIIGLGRNARERMHW